MLRWYEHKQVYHPTREWVAEPGAAEDVYFSATDGVRLNGWFYSARAGSPRAHLVMLFCHGNGGNISHRVELCAALLRTGINLFIFDYRGYGRSEGHPGEEGTYRDTQGAYCWLRERGFAAENIIAFGESLGGAIASDLAAREPIGGLVLQSAFTSIPDIGTELFPWLPVRLLSSINYNTLGNLSRVKAPVLVMHSREDQLVRFHHAERNFAEANEPKLFWETTGGHDYSLDVDFESSRLGIEKFLELLEQRGREKSSTGADR